MAAPSISTKQIPPALVGLSYSEQFNGTGGLLPVSWTLVFGSLPPGMSLSGSGLLTAIAGAIPADAVGTYTFRLRLRDSTPLDDFFDYTMEVVPSGFNRVQEFLLDDKLRSLYSRVASDPVTRAKVERHFFRNLLGAINDTFAHMDVDILSNDWITPGNNVDIRTALEDVRTLVMAAVKTINSIGPTAGGDYTFQAGTGITATPIVNGLRLDVPPGPVSGADHQQLIGLVASGTEMPLVLPSEPALIQAALHEVVSDTWIPFGNIPSYSGKKLNPNYYTLSNSVMGMASGAEAAGTKVLHICWCDVLSGVWHMSRLNQESMVVIEDAILSGPIGSQGYPLVMAGCAVNDVVFASFIDLLGAMYYVAMDPSDYTNAALPYVTAATPILVSGPTFMAMQNGNKVIGALSPTIPYAYVSSLGFVAGNWVPVIIEFTPGPSWAPTGNYYAMPFGGVTGGSLFDMIVDDQNSALPPGTQSLATFGVDQVQWAPVADNFMFWNLRIPIVAPGMTPMSMVPAVGPWVVRIVDNASPGDSYRQGCIALDDFQFGLTRRTALLAYTTVSYWGFPIISTVRCSLVKNIWGPAAPSVMANLSLPKASKESYAVDSPYCGFVRWYYYGEGTPQARIMFFDWYCGPNGSNLMRSLFAVNSAVLDSPVSVGHTKSPYPIRMITTRSMYDPDFVPSPGFVAPFVYLGDTWAGGLEDNVMMMADPHFTDEDLRLEWRPGTLSAVVVNNSPFEWEVKIDTLAISTTDAPPQNLLMACYQIAQALKNFYTASVPPSFYPSPSVAGGVIWTEAQLDVSNTLGFIFGSYYGVPAGQYDLVGGTIAQAEYYADEAAGSASDQTLVFRYAIYPVSMVTALGLIKVAIDAYIAGTGPLPTGTGSDPDFFTLSEMDAIMGTAFAAAYNSPPFTYYRYFCFANVAGNAYEHGFYSQNYVRNNIAYGPAPSTGSAIPVQEQFTQVVPCVANVPVDYTLTQAVTAARVYVNGVMYIEGLDWEFAGMDVIRYKNRSPGGFVLPAGAVITVEKYLL